MYVQFCIIMFVELFGQKVLKVDDLYVQVDKEASYGYSDSKPVTNPQALSLIESIALRKLLQNRYLK